MNIFILYLYIYNLGNVALMINPPRECPINDSLKCYFILLDFKKDIIYILNFKDIY